jgi:uncharacterized membrane protein
MPATEEKKILRVYAAFAASLVLMLMPNAAIAVLAALLMMGSMIAAYMKRRAADPHSLTADHMNFLIRTIWIGSGLAAVTTSIACVYMMKTADHAPLQVCSNNAAQKILESGTEDIKVINAMLQPCVHDFIAANTTVLINSVAMAATLPLIYFAFRTAKGLRRAARGHRIGDGKSWL